MNKKHEESFKKYLDKGGLPCIDVKINDNNYVFLIDSGSDISYIDSNIAEDLGLYVVNGLTTIVASIGANSPEAVTYKAKLKLTEFETETDLTGIELRKTTNQLIVPFDGIIGVDILRNLKATISFEKDKLIY